jgi:hypothetical protein
MNLFRQFKHNNLAPLFVASLLAIAFSASTASAGVQIGGLLGYRSNNFQIDGAGSSSGTSASGYNFGGIVTFSFLDTLGFRTGVILSDKTANVSGSGIEQELKLGYIDIPLNIEIGIPAAPIYLLGGVIFSTKSTTSCSVKNGGGNCTADIKSTNTSLNFGVGYTLVDLVAGSVGIEAQYEHGISAINNSGSGSTYTRGLSANLLARVGF